MRKFFTASKPGVFAGLWTAALLLLVNCPIPLGDDWTIPDPKNRSPYVVIYDLTSYVPVPVAGETAVFTLDRADLKVTVAWQNGEGTAIEGPLVFERYGVYRAEITLEVQNDYLFDSERPFEYVDETKIISQSSEDNADRHKRVVRVEYLPAQGPRTVDELDLSKYIAKPKTGWVPTLSFVGAQYIGSVQWSVVSDAGAGSAGSSANGVYKPKTKYQATVALSALSGWTFTGLKDGDFYYTDEEGSEDEINVSNDANGLVTLLFEITDPTYIEEINLQDYVPVPMAGEAPVKSVATPENVKIAVKWTDEAGNEAPEIFEIDVAYRAEISMTVDVEKGYVFSPNFKAAYPDGTVIAQIPRVGATNDTWIVDAEYKPSVMAVPVPETNRDLAPYLPRPETGGEPKLYFTTEHYNGLVEWTAEGNAHGGPFRANTVYTATVTVGPVAGYTLAGLGADFFIHTGDPEASISFDGGRAVTIRFSMAMSPITGPVNLTPYLPIPESGRKPGKSLQAQTGSSFTGSVSWSGSGNWNPETDKFKPGDYTAKVSLIPAAGYVLDGLQPDSFTHDGALSVAYEDGTVTLAFTIETEIIAGPIDLSPYLPIPAAGVTQRTTLLTPSGSSFTGSILWSPVDSKFKLGETYSAAVKLTAVEGYILGALDKGSFYHDGADDWEYDPDTSTATLIFKIDWGRVPATIDLSSYLAAPAAGAAPWKNLVVPPGSVFAGTVSWSDNANNPKTDNFAPGTYTAAITLTPVEGYILEDLTHVYHNGAENGGVDVEYDASAGTARAELRFEIPWGKVPETIDLTMLLPVPAAGEMPRDKLSVLPGSVFTGTVSWSDNANNPKADNFTPGTYKAAVTLAPAEGYILDDLTHVYHNGAENGGVDVVSNEDGTKTAELRFEIPWGRVPETIDLTLYLPPPAAGGTPQRTLSVLAGSAFTGTVSWEPATDKFTPGTYRAAVTLSPAAGYTLADLKHINHNFSGSVDVAHQEDGTATADLYFTIDWGRVPETIDLTLLLSAPTAGGTPQEKLSVLPGSVFTGTVIWSDNENNPKAGKFTPGTYKAAVTLAPAEGYTLEDLKHINHSLGGGSVPVAPNEGGTKTAVLEFTIPWGRVPETIDLTSYLTAPVMGAAPLQRLLVPARSFFTGTVSWTDSEGKPVTGKFQPGAYTAAVTLSPAEGYTLEDLKEVQHDGAKAIGFLVYHRDDLGKVATVTAEITFEIAHTGIPVPVNLTAYLDAPEAGKTPQRELKTPARSPFTGNINWTPNDGTFTAGKSYRAEVILTANAAEGYTLQGLEQGDFYHNATDDVTYNPSSNTVRIVFGEVPKDVISGVVDLGLYLPVPAIGVAPRKNLSVPAGSSFAGTVSWKDTGNNAWIDTMPFLMEGAYTATIALTPESSYKFAEDIAFSHSGIAGTNVSRSDDQVTVTIPFEPFMPRIIATTFGSDQNAANSVMKALDTYQDTYGLFITLPGGNEAIGGLAGNASLSPGARFSRLVIDGDNRNVSLATKRPFIEVRAGMTVTLKNFHIAGNAGNEYPVIRVMEGGTLNLENVVITGNANDSNRYPAGGMLIEGKVNMTGGEVLANTFTSKGNDTSPGAGGVYIRSGGEFTMTNGKIDRNIGSTTGSSTKVVGGVYIEESKDNEEGFVMDGDSSVSNNTGACLYQAYAGSYICSGVLVMGTFRMKGGSIEGNGFGNSKGTKGAVAVGASASDNLSGKFIMSGKAKVADGNYVYGPITVEGSLEGSSIVAYFYDEALKTGDSNYFVALRGDFVNQRDRFSLGGNRTIGSDGYFTW